MGNHIMLRAFREGDIPPDETVVRVVRERDQEGFVVSRRLTRDAEGRRSRYFVIDNPTAWAGQFKVADSVAGVRRVIASAP